MHKKTGVSLPVPTYPRLDRAKTGIFSIAVPAGGAANRRHRAIGVIWGTTRRETHIIAAPDPFRQPKLSVEGSQRSHANVSDAYAAIPAC